MQNKFRLILNNPLLSKIINFRFVRGIFYIFSGSIIIFLYPFLILMIGIFILVSIFLLFRKKNYRQGISSLLIGLILFILLKTADLIGFFGVKFYTILMTIGFILLAYGVLLIFFPRSKPK